MQLLSSVSEFQIHYNSRKPNYPCSVPFPGRVSAFKYLRRNNRIIMQLHGSLCAIHCFAGYTKKLNKDKS